MSAIVRLGTTQAKVSEGDRIKVEKIDAPAGETIEIKEVLALITGEETEFGAPTVEGATVEAKVIRHGRGKKITVFKMKRRKRYRLKRGHRQDFTEIEIDRIIRPGAGEPRAEEPRAETQEERKEASNGA